MVTHIIDDVSKFSQISHRYTILEDAYDLDEPWLKYVLAFLVAMIFYADIVNLSWDTQR